MASIDIGLYDYNGAVYAFGVVKGYSTVGSVRMYASDGQGNTYQYLSTQVYSHSDARINASLYGSSSCVFNVRTDRDAEDGYPTQLDYDVEDPEDSSGRGRYKLSFHFYTSTDGTGSPLNSTVLTPSANGYSDVWYQMHNSLPTPSISYDESTNKIRLSNVGDYRYMIEVKKKNRVDSDFSVEVRDFAYTVLMKNLEGTQGGKYTEAVCNWQADWDNPVLTCRYFYIWDANRKFPYYVLVVFDSGAGFSDDEATEYLSIVEDAFSEISKFTGMSVSVSYTSSDIYDKNDPYGTVETYGAAYGIDSEYEASFIVRIGNDKTMATDGSWQGFWENWAIAEDPAEGVLQSMANINVDASESHESTAHVIHEEIYQSLNIGADNFEQPMSIHWDPHYTNPDSYSIADSYNDDVMWDEEILKFCYAQNMNGWTPIDFINNVDTPCCLLQDYISDNGYYEFDLSDLISGEYEIYGWVADQGTSNPGGGTLSAMSHYNWDGGWDDAPYSIKSYLDVVIGGKPAVWYWDQSNGGATAAQTSLAYTAITNKGALSNFSYLVWNDLVDKVSEAIAYAGLSNTAVGSEHTLPNGFSGANTYSELLAAAYMTSGDKLMTAVRFNCVRYCIGSLQSTGIDPKSTGEIIYGEYFTMLTDALNTWIGA